MPTASTKKQPRRAKPCGQRGVMLAETAILVGIILPIVIAAVMVVGPAVSKRFCESSIILKTGGDAWTMQLLEWGVGGIGYQWDPVTHVQRCCAQTLNCARHSEF